MLFWLGKQILDWTAGLVAATSYAVMAASPAMLGLAGHATHFAAFFVTAGLCVMWKARQNASWLMVFPAGLLFGVGVLMKQHVAFIGLWAVMAFIVQRVRQTQLPPAKRFWPVTTFGVGMILPFSVCCLILWHAGVFEKFWFWTIDYARQYESVVPIDQAPRLFWERLCHLAVADPLLWLVAVTGLGLVWFDGRLQPARLWLLGFCLMSALIVVPGFYFRKHYFLLILPAAALLAGCAVSGARRLWSRRAKKTRPGDWPVWCYALMVATTIMTRSDIWFVKTPVQIARTI
jgi:4-amino-4-deoxy-L-arabinose transferase-like glycosyltransferase